MHSDQVICIFTSAFNHQFYFYDKIYLSGIIRPKTWKSKDQLNAIVVIITDSLILYFSGVSALFYMILSLALGMGLHPVAGHFISEHYMFVEGQETYSYYGSLNKLCWNVGYHNEHHDFPRVPGLSHYFTLQPYFDILKN